MGVGGRWAGGVSVEGSKGDGCWKNECQCQLSTVKHR